MAPVPGTRQSRFNWCLASLGFNVGPYFRVVSVEPGQHTKKDAPTLSLDPAGTNRD